MLQAILVVAAVWFFAYWLSSALESISEFSSVIATGVSICGVSASIAAGGGGSGRPQRGEATSGMADDRCGHLHSSLCLLWPKWMGLPGNMAGAWLGGVIDNTGGGCRRRRGLWREGCFERCCPGQDGTEHLDRVCGFSACDLGNREPGEESDR